MCGRCGCVRLGPRVGPDRPAQVEGLLEAALLLILREGRGYGYELAADVSRRGLIQQPVPAPRVYEALRRLEREDAVTSAHEASPGGPDRRLYRLTPLGIERLDRWAGALRSAQRGLSAFLSAYDSKERR